MISKTKIYLVDDHDLVREGIRALLEFEENIDIIGEASDGDEFISMIKNNQPDIVLLDITMPVMSGIEVAKKISVDYPDIKKIILSSSTTI